MIIAVLFNSDDPCLGEWYGSPIQKTILKSGVLQNANRHLKIGFGDVLLWHANPTSKEYLEIAGKAFFRNNDKWRMSDKLRQSYRDGTIYAWVIQNATTQIADDLDKELKEYPPYLGIITVDISFGPHVALYRMLIGEKYRIIGANCSIFYAMGEIDEIDNCQIEELLQCGFKHVDIEDAGARGTIFDEFDTPSHYAQINSFIALTSDFFPGGENDAYELSMILSDFEPQTFQFNRRCN